MSNQKEDREFWLNLMKKIADPVLYALKEGKLIESMPVGRESRRSFAHLEAIGRLFCGIAPWIESKKVNETEEKERQIYAELCRNAIDSITDPASPDYIEFLQGIKYGQTLVDAAFLCQGILRAKTELWDKLSDKTKKNLVESLKKTRKILPGRNNWLLFSAIIEAFFYAIDEDYDIVRIDYAIYQHEQWYKGDGIYGDGVAFHADYYNSFVIIPMLYDTLNTVKDFYGEYGVNAFNNVLRNAKRYAAILERIIAPDGTFPVVGRSSTYRTGALQVLAQMAYTHNLPADITPAQTRCALTAAIKRCFANPDNFDENNWLRIGFCGYQPSMGEGYISTGSLYLCSAVFLPLGLNEDEEFWSSDPELYTSQKIWSGIDVKADHAI